LSKEGTEDYTKELITKWPKAVAEKAYKRLVVSGRLTSIQKNKKMSETTIWPTT
jgi:hypothetical protein